MDLEFHQLDRRYEQLRRACRKRDGQVLASLDRDGQQLPVVVVAGGEAERYILVDGFKRVRGLVKLGRDIVWATCWDLPEDEALLLGRLMQNREGDSALEQGWLLRELRERFELSIEELARRFGRSPSWIGRRLGLVGVLPEEIQREVRDGRLIPHAAMQFFLPLARVNRSGAIALAAAVAPLRPSSRQTKVLCVAFARSKGEARQHLLEHPEQFLRVQQSVGEPSLPVGPGELLQRDLGALQGIARRAAKRLDDGAVRELLPPEYDALLHHLASTRAEAVQLFDTLTQEIDHARRAHQNDHPHTP